MRKYATLFGVGVLLLTASMVGCGGDDEPTPPKKGDDKPAVVDCVKADTLPWRQAKVYFGFANKFNEVGNAANYGQWEYTRSHLDGYYTNFIQMWMINFQNSLPVATTLKNIYNALTHKSAFFEGTMETAVNSDANGNNDLTTDRRTFDQLTAAGFTVDYASVNYMTVATKAKCQERIQLFKNYKGARKCLYLNGPWTFNGDINNDKDALTMLSWCDGASTDGPLGFWYNNGGKMRSGSYSVVRAAAKQGKISAVMLAPYDAGVSEYKAKRNFLQTSKDCVLGHEDNGAAPDLWTIWIYGENGEKNNDSLGLFPESAEQNGVAVPQNTATGVAYWLLKHLNSFPTLYVDNAAARSDVYRKAVTAGQEAIIALRFTNEANPEVELSPVIRAIYASNPDWDVKFKVGATDVTQDMVKKGGLNCISRNRISKTSPLVVTLTVKPLKRNAAMLNMQLQVMSNLSNTARRATALNLRLAAQ